MEKLGLKEIAQVLGCFCEEDVTIHSVSTDTRTIETGCLFIALAGERFDAHDFVTQAVESGAVALVCEKPVAENRVPVLYVENTRKAYLDIAGYYRSLFDIPLVGITGSVGKTTTKEFVALALSVKYNTLKTEGNFNNDIGMPKTLLRLDKSTQAAVIEMGMNHFGEIHELVLRSRPTMGVITNIGVSHIENLGSKEGILKAKLELLDGMAAGAPLLLNADNDLLATVRLTDRPLYSFGIENEGADFRACNITGEEGKTRFTVCYAAGETEITIPCSGNHNVLNALCAFAVGVLNGIDAAAVAAKLNEYVPAGMRQRQVDCGTFTVIEDCYNASPDSMRAALQTLAGLGATKTVAVLADMLELGTFSKTLHEEVGAFAAAGHIDVLLCYGKDARYYLQAAKEGGIQNAWHFSTQEALLEGVLEQIEPGCAVLFKGSHGMHLEKVIKALYERKGIEK